MSSETKRIPRVLRATDRHPGANAGRVGAHGAHVETQRKANTVRKGPEAATEPETWEEPTARVDEMPGPGGDTGPAGDGSDDSGPRGSSVSQTPSRALWHEANGLRSQPCVSTSHTRVRQDKPLAVWGDNTRGPHTGPDLPGGGRPVHPSLCLRGRFVPNAAVVSLIYVP